MPGVADMVTFGGLVKTYEVNPDLAKMRYYGIALAAALHRAGPRQRQRRRQQGDARARSSISSAASGMLRSADEINDIVITAHNGTPVLVKDIADCHARQPAR